ncbi:DNA-directed RNA polymerase subunit beta [Haploplasma axanthum]|uniref:DNA-directed RNA polymerase subunit beta n=2 Tax=Haploplasma axanthum TaxID=29552 RepID=A0A449BCP3_HAPAX|nr:DNA-directed RNA polymerase subunit beta [Haploplasma axanthum]VEU80198.1 DNA-directed RNA polymerase subunit beta [Haploplasma axanthum]
MGNNKGFKEIKYGKKAVRRNYSKMRYDIELPNLIEIQTKSFEDFINFEISELLKDISPIVGHNGELKLYFEDHFLEDPKYSIEESKNRDMSYTRQLFANVKLESVREGQVRESKVLMTEIPFMTPNGTFVINGAERVVVSQIIRSSGAYFSKEHDTKYNEDKYAAQVIPTRGAWIEYETAIKPSKKSKKENDRYLYVKVDRSRKIPMTTFMRAIGLSKNKEIFDVFGQGKAIKDTLEIDETKNSDEAIVELYSKLRQDDKVPANAAREFLRLRLFEPRRYDLAPVGRYKLNKKLDVLNRIRDAYIAEDIIDPLTGEVLVAKDTQATRNVIEILKENRHALRTEVISAADSLQNESPDEIFAERSPEGGDKLFAKDNIVNLRSGEIVVAKGEEITDETIITLQRNRQNLDEQVIKYFLEGKSVYEKENERTGVIVEKVSVYVLGDENEVSEKSKKIDILGNDQREDKIYITLSDIVASMSYYLSLYEKISEHEDMEDDIDHLGNRRLRLIGELLKNQFRIGLARTEKNIKDKMSTVSFADATPTGIVNMSPLSGAIKTFFGSSQLSQFMDQVNPLSELTQKRRVSALGTGGLARDRAGVEVRDVHNTHYGRICPIETPEGPSIGLISSLATYGKVDEYGFIQTPYLKLNRDTLDENGLVIPKVEKEYVYLTADEEQEEIIASAATLLDENGYIVEDRVIGRSRGETNMYTRDEITFMDVSPKQIVSVATATIPFLEHDDATRALMGANMQRQAVPLINPDSPIVGTGIEYRAAKDSGSVVVAQNPGIVSYVDANKVVITKQPDEIVKVGGTILYDPKVGFNVESANLLRNYGMDESDTYELIKFNRSNQDTCILQKPLVETGETIEKGDIIADGPSTAKGELALGRNVTVAFMTWDGYNYEDAIIMSEELVKNDVYTSIHIDQYEIETRDIKAAGSNYQEEITREVPNAGADALKSLDEDGIIIVGSEVKEGDILVGKITPKGVNDPTPSERLIQSILGDKSREYRDTSLRVPHGGGGVVEKVQCYSKENGDVLPSGVNKVIKVFVAKKRKIREGDKMAGRHGNKGVISKILPREDMPYMADGTPVDIMLNPLGVPSRMNIGQVLEIHLGMAARKLGLKIATPVFDGVSDDDLKAIMKEAGIDEDGKTVLYDGRTGEPFDNRISVGVMYMIKLSHMVDDKLHARAVGPYTLVTQQPMGGKAQNGGQRFGEMEVWALYAYGAAHTLQEILTVKSDDMLGRNKVYSAITHGKDVPRPSIPESFRVFTRELQSLGLYVELIDNKTGENEALKSIFQNSKRGGNR